MSDTIDAFINIKYVGTRFDGGQLPLDVLADLQALEDILTTFARDLWLARHGRERMPNGFPNWFEFSLIGVEDGSAVPRLRLNIADDFQPQLIGHHERHDLIKEAEFEFAKVLRAANAPEKEVVLSPTQIRNFNRFLTNLKPGELFSYTAPAIDNDLQQEIISLDVERRNRFLKSVKPTYETRLQGKARLKSVDESGTLRFVTVERKDFSLTDNTVRAHEYGANIGSYYDYDLTVRCRHDDNVQDVLTIHDLSLVDHPLINTIDTMSSLEDGWLDGHGKAVPENVRNNAKNFISAAKKLPTFYAAAPTEDGGILLEFKVLNWDYGLEFNLDDTISFFAVDLQSDNEMWESFQAQKLHQLIDRVTASIVDHE